MLLWLRGAAAAEEPSQVDSLDAIDSTSVVLDGVPLFRVAGSTSFPSSRRAQDVSERIAAVARDTSIPANAVAIVNRDSRVDIVARDKHIVAVVDADAQLEGVAAPDVAQVRAARISDAIARYRTDRQPAQLARAGVTALIVTAIAIVLLLLARRAFRFAFDAFERRYRSRVQSVKLQSYEVVRAENIWNAVQTALRIVRTFVLLAFSYVYLTVVLREFPWTRGTAASLIDVVVDPLKSMGLALLQYLPKLVFVILLAFAVRYLLKVTNALASAVGEGRIPLRGFDADWAQPTYNILRVLIILLALVVAYPYLPGSGSAAFQGLSIFAGLMLSLGASSAMASIIAGYTVTYRRAFRVGDRITIGDLTGEVTQVRLLVTHLRTDKNEEVVVPNSMVLQNQVVNYSKLAKEQGLILHANVGIGYETPWRQVEAMLLMAAERTNGLLRQPQPFVLERALGDFSVTYEINAYVDEARGMMKRYAALHRNILDVFNEYGVQIMTPGYEGDPELPKVVPKEQWYTEPAREPADGDRPVVAVSRGA